ncbi:hypothetical protein Fot_30081 [Forsythia ovata]|uniref:Uncharacterized protein n=1 Tax=Forsythia ovata TaxID=205694 RepID=A0ABD1TUJ7_9LAMI
MQMDADVVDDREVETAGYESAEDVRQQGEGDVETSVDTGVETMIEGDPEVPVDTRVETMEDDDDAEEAVEACKESDQTYGMMHNKILSRSHWYSVDVDIVKSTMFIYNPDRSYSMDDQIIADLQPMNKILPMLLKKFNIFIDALAIEWITTTSKQSNS